MLDIQSIEVFLFERPRSEPYLGTLKGDVMLEGRYVVRAFNGTIYPVADRSIVVKLTDRNGVVGWGETYGLVAPAAVAAIIHDLFAPYLKVCTFADPPAAWDGLYELQRNRGYWGGYLADALAALDIAMWDIHARRAGQSLQCALGKPGAAMLPAYVSGLPGASRQQRAELAAHWQEKGFGMVKIPISHTDDGDVAGEYESLRAAVGENHKIALDMHWAYTVGSGVALSRQLEPHSPWFLEAPVAPEDIAAQRAFAIGSRFPTALGEEWRTEWDYVSRRGCCAIVQPEMGHTGVSQFMRIGRLAEADGAEVIPHATIGLGIFAAASLRAALALGASAHEFQHTVYARNAELLDGAASCTAGAFNIPDSDGHGVVPTRDGLKFLTPIDR